MGHKTEGFIKLVVGSIVAGFLVLVLFVDSVTFKDFGKKDDGSDFDISEVADGVYKGSAVGHNGGDLVVEVTVAGGKITKIDVISHTETATLTDPAFEQVPASIIENNSLDVDSVSGVTVTSNTIKEAVKNALTGEATDTNDSDDDSSATDDESGATEGADNEVVDQTDLNYENGVFEGVTTGHNGGDLVVQVTVEGNKIVKVEVLEHTETDGIADPAFDTVPNAIVENNGSSVDTVSGATVTSKAIQKAVDNALEGKLID